jgi:hypothetical protein
MATFDLLRSLGTDSGATITTADQTMALSERRHRRRADLHCNLYIAKTTWTSTLAPTLASTSASASTLTSPVACRTKNISSGGFYCFSKEALTAGEWVQCTIIFPDTAEGSDGFALKCTVEVLRVEPVEAGQLFGLACRIEDYCVVPHPDDFSTIQ